ncbi:phosphoketolase family protein [Candidatus Binatus sp.]|jgi:xylulose-5-phosphate/fructose-6-phosphate phosphoketolase|uniref:phosphoketolase family protein n=1 Tax=Candidatus Binatus sp. TaxID=2811406 RepID=UPI003F99ECF0
MSTLAKTSEAVRVDEKISAYGTARSTVKGTPLSSDELRKVDAYWRATLYLSLGMLYLKENPLLREPLKIEQTKPRLLGHWGSDAGQSFSYIHFNRLIKKYDLNAIFISGPGHGAPAVLSNAYLEGTYSEIYPDKSEDLTGMQRFFKQFSFPGGIGSHATPETPGSIHEGGELGYSISHAYGTVYDHPDLFTLVMVGDGESETGPLATSWHSNKFLNPITDGAVLPVLHLNGYKINNPTVLARISHEELEALFVGYGYTPYFVEGSDPQSMHQAMAATMEHCVLEIRKIQDDARRTGQAIRPRWPMIVLRSPKGWTAPRQVDDHYLEGFWRAHQIPITDIATNPKHLEVLESWMRSYKPEELFDSEGRLIPELKALAPKGNRRMSANPIANGGLVRKPLELPDFRSSAVEVKKPGATLAGNVPTLANFLREVMRRNMDRFRVFGPDETQSNRLEAIYEVAKKVWLAEYFPEDADGGELAPNGRVMEILSEHTVEGWLEGYILSGRHGLLNSYEPFIHVIDSMFNQHAKWLEKCNELPWRANVSSLNLLITALVWRQDHNGFTHQDPGFLDVVANKSPSIVRIYLPPDANCLLSVADHCLQSVNYVNVIVADKQVHLQYLDMEAAIEHCTKGVGIWSWASNDEGAEPDVVMASCGDCPTMESLAAAALLREHLPDVKVRFVNVVDLFKLVPSTEHAHGLTDREFEAIFTPDKPVIFNFHSYPWLIHRLTYRRPGQRNIHVRGYKEKGNINTPLELAIQNQTDRFSLAIDAIDRMPRFQVKGAGVREALLNHQIDAKNHAHEFGIDPQDITNWQWPF